MDNSKYNFARTVVVNELTAHKGLTAEQILNSERGGILYLDMVLRPETGMSTQDRINFLKLRPQTKEVLKAIEELSKASPAEC